MRLVTPVRNCVLMQMNLDETINTDKTELRPAQTNRSSRVEFPTACVTLERCNAAQTTAMCARIDYALAH